MQAILILALLIMIVAVVFALQNTAPVVVSFFFWKFQGSLALVLLFALLTGALVSILLSVPGFARNRWSIASMRKKIASLETSLNEARGKIDALQMPPATPTPPASPQPASGGSEVPPQMP